MSFFKSIFNLKLSEAKIYRENLIINFIFGLFPLLISIFLWKTIFKVSNRTIGEFDFKKMITYFLLVFFINYISSAKKIAMDISETIQDGTIASLILKPISFFKYQYNMFLIEKFILFLNLAIPLIIFILLLQNYLFIHIFKLGLFFISSFLAITLNFIIYLILGISVIWIGKISSLLDLWNNLTFLLAGGAFPLNIISPKFYNILVILPFKYIIFTPINIYIGNLSSKDIFKEFCFQILWIILLFILFKIVWNKGKNTISGYGL